MKVLASHLYNYMEYAQTRGVSLHEMMKLIKQPLPDMNNETATVSDKDFYAVIDKINQTLKDEIWGIKAGNFLSLKLLGVIYKISLQSTTIEEAFHYLQSYITATLPLLNISTSITNKTATVEIKILNDKNALNRIIIENALAIISKEITIMVSDDALIKLTTPFYNDAYPYDWKKGKLFSISFEPVVLKALIKTKSHLQLDILLPEYLQIIEGLKLNESFSNKVRMTMLSMADPRLPNLQTVSNALYITSRTLQRKLGDENVSYRQIMEDLKKKICSFLLRHNSYSVSDISYVLGYSEPAAFIHSFKKWYGDSPERMRHQFRSV